MKRIEQSLVTCNRWPHQGGHSSWNMNKSGPKLLRIKGSYSPFHNLFCKISSVRESFTWGPNLHGPPVTRSHNLSSLTTHAVAHAIDFYFDIPSNRRPWFKIILMIISDLGKDRVLAVLPRGSSVRPQLWDLWHERHVKLGAVFYYLSVTVANAQDNSLSMSVHVNILVVINASYQTYKT